jgi:hypothetical protein
MVSAKTIDVPRFLDGYKFACIDDVHKFSEVASTILVVFSAVLSTIIALENILQ